MDADDEGKNHERKKKKRRHRKQKKKIVAIARIVMGASRLDKYELNSMSWPYFTLTLNQYQYHLRHMCSTDKDSLYYQLRSKKKRQFRERSDSENVDEKQTPKTVIQTVESQKSKLDALQMTKEPLEHHYKEEYSKSRTSTQLATDLIQDKKSLTTPLVHTQISPRPSQDEHEKTEKKKTERLSSEETKITTKITNMSFGKEETENLNLFLVPPSLEFTDIQHTIQEKNIQSSSHRRSGTSDKKEAELVAEMLHISSEKEKFFEIPTVSTVESYVSQKTLPDKNKMDIEIAEPNQPIKQLELRVSSHIEKRVACLPAPSAVSEDIQQFVHEKQQIIENGKIPSLVQEEVRIEPDIVNALDIETITSESLPLPEKFHDTSESKEVIDREISTDKERIMRSNLKEYEPKFNIEILDVSSKQETLSREEQMPVLDFQDSSKTNQVVKRKCTEPDKILKLTEHKEEIEFGNGKLDIASEQAYSITFEEPIIKSPSDAQNARIDLEEYNIADETVSKPKEDYTKVEKPLSKTSKQHQGKLKWKQIVHSKIFDKAKKDLTVEPTFAIPKRWKQIVQAKFIENIKDEKVLPSTSYEKKLSLIEQPKLIDKKDSFSMKQTYDDSITRENQILTEQEISKSLENFEAKKLSADNTQPILENEKQLAKTSISSEKTKYHWKQIKSSIADGKYKTPSPHMHSQQIPPERKTTDFEKAKLSWNKAAKSILERAYENERKSFMKVPSDTQSVESKKAKFRWKKATKAIIEGKYKRDEKRLVKVSPDIKSVKSEKVKFYWRKAAKTIIEGKYKSDEKSFTEGLPDTKLTKSEKVKFQWRKAAKSIMEGKYETEEKPLVPTGTPIKTYPIDSDQIKLLWKKAAIRIIERNYKKGKKPSHLKKTKAKRYWKLIAKSIRDGKYLSQKTPTTHVKKPSIHTPLEEGKAKVYWKQVSKSIRDGTYLYDDTPPIHSSLAEQASKLQKNVENNDQSISLHETDLNDSEPEIDITEDSIQRGREAPVKHEEPIGELEASVLCFRWKSLTDPLSDDLKFIQETYNVETAKDLSESESKNCSDTTKDDMVSKEKENQNNIRSSLHQVDKQNQLNKMKHVKNYWNKIAESIRVKPELENSKFENKDKLESDRKYYNLEERKRKSNTEKSLPQKEEITSDSQLQERNDKMDVNEKPSDFYCKSLWEKLAESVRSGKYRNIEVQSGHENERISCIESEVKNRNHTKEHNLTKEKETQPTNIEKKMDTRNSKKHHSKHHWTKVMKSIKKSKHEVGAVPSTAVHTEEEMSKGNIQERTGNSIPSEKNEYIKGSNNDNSAFRRKMYWRKLKLSIKNQKK